MGAVFEFGDLGALAEAGAYAAGIAVLLGSTIGSYLLDYHAPTALSSSPEDPPTPPRYSTAQ